MVQLGGRPDAQTVARKPGRMRPSPLVVGRMLEAQKRERDLIVREFGQVRGLMPLLMRKRNGGHWTREERRELREQMQALAHLSPYLVVLALPGSFMFLPVLAWWLDRRRIRRSGSGPGADAPA
jgi:hypothetical protein